jgi:hypothetical protein
MSDSSADCADKEQRLRRPAIDKYALTTNLGTSLVHTSPKTISAKPVRASLCNPILKDRSCTADSRQDTAKMQSCPGEWDFLPWALEIIDAQVP